jgi:hypothetical protein
MKNLILLFAIVCLAMQAQAQKLMTMEVPASILDVFNRTHPSIKEAEWSKIGDNYEVKYAYTLDKTLTYNVSGSLVEKEMEIAATTLPKMVALYMRENHKEYKIRGAFKATDSNKNITYIVAIKGMVLTFDSKGAFIRSVES